MGLCVGIVYWRLSFPSLLLFEVVDDRDDSGEEECGDRGEEGRGGRVGEVVWVDGAEELEEVDWVPPWTGVLEWDGFALVLARRREFVRREVALRRGREKDMVEAVD